MSYSNKWISGSCPTVNEFYVDKSKTAYHIQYYKTKVGVSKSNSSWKKIKENISALKMQILEIKGSIDSPEYRAESESVISALDAVVVALDNNITKLFTAVVSRMNASAESDEWFGETAALYANYIARGILGIHGADMIKPNSEAYTAAPSAENLGGTSVEDAQLIADADQILAGLNNSGQDTAQSTPVATEAKPEKAGFWGRLGATIGTFASGVVEGIVNVGEMAVDAVTIGAATLMTPLTAAADAVGAVSSAITGTEYKSATADMWKDAAGFVSKDYSTDWFDSYYNNTGLGQTLKNNSYAFDFTRGAGKVTGEYLTFNAAGSALKGLTSGVKVINGGASGAYSPLSPLPLNPSGSSSLALEAAPTLQALPAATRTVQALPAATGASYAALGSESSVVESVIFSPELMKAMANVASKTV